MRPVRLVLAAALALSLASLASATPTDFGLTLQSREFVVSDDVITFRASLASPVTLIGWEFLFAYDTSELTFLEAKNFEAALTVSTAPAGDALHDPSGQKILAIGFSPSGVAVTHLFDISFIVHTPVQDGAFDDLFVVVSPGGCDALPTPNDCLSLQSPDGLVGPGGLSETEEIGNPRGFRVEVGVEDSQIQAIVPEPAAFALVASGLIPLFLRRRR